MMLRLNQVTLAATDMAASLSFYQNLGLTLIVDSAPRYVRFEFPSPEVGEPSTLSLHSVDETWTPHNEQPLIYFEVENLEAFINKCNLSPIAPPEMKSYKWHEADILDPAGNRIRLYTAGQNRRYPPWRIS